MGQSGKTDKGAVPREVPAKPQGKREEVRWPSAVTSSGGAYIPSHIVHGAASLSVEG